MLTAACGRFFDKCDIEAGIARTRGLMENMWATAVCFQACIGILITGPPGVGKTLALQEVMRNMAGASSPQPDFHALKSLQKFAYQCSASSTATEIEQVDCRVREVLCSDMATDVVCLHCLSRCTSPHRVDTSSC